MCLLILVLQYLYTIYISSMYNLKLKFKIVSTNKNLTELIGMSNENRMEDQITFRSHDFNLNVLLINFLFFLRNILGNLLGNLLRNILGNLLRNIRRNILGNILGLLVFVFCFCVCFGYLGFFLFVIYFVCFRHLVFLFLSGT